MRTLAVLFVLFSLDAFASQPDDERPFLEAPEAAWGCIQELAANSARGALLKDPLAHEKSVSQFLQLGAASWLLRPGQQFSLDQLRTLELQTRFQVLFDTRLVQIAIAEEIEARNLDVEKVARGFLATFPEAKEQARFLDGVVQRILSRLKISCFGNLRKIQGTPRQPPRTQLPSIQWLLLDDQYLSGFAELEIVILQKLGTRDEVFIQSILDSQSSRWRRFWRWVWRNPLLASIDVEAKLTAMLADPLEGPLHLVRFLREAKPVLRDFFITRNLPLFSSELLRRIVTELRLTGPIQETIDRELRAREAR